MGGGPTTRTEPWDAQKPYLVKGFTGAEELLKAESPEYYQGATLAGFDPAQTASQQAMLGYAMGPRTAGMQQGAEGALGRSLGGYTGFDSGQTADLLAGNVDLGPNSPFASTANALQQQVMGNLQGNILPGLRQQTMTYQPGGGSRGNLVQNKAIANAVQQGLTKPMADMYSDAYQTAQAQRLPFAQMGIGQQQFGQQAYPSLMAAPMGMYKAMGDVGAQRRAMSQEAINQDRARYDYESQAPMNALQQYMANISGDYGSTTKQSPSGLQQVGQLASIFGAFGSDIRIKDNIIPEGTKWHGFDVYSFNYKEWYGDPLMRRRGVMAQDVERTRPDAVIDIGGIKHVDYFAL